MKVAIMISYNFRIFHVFIRSFITCHTSYAATVIKENIHQFRMIGFLNGLNTAEINVSQTSIVFNNSADESTRELGALVSLDAGMDADQLRAALQARLPAYMVPTKLVFTTDDFPRTPNGKYDRKLVLKAVFGG